MGEHDTPPTSANFTWNTALTYTGTNPSYIYGGDTTGDDLIIRANNVNALPLIYLYGNLNIEMSVAQHCLVHLPTNTNARWFAVINSDVAFCAQFMGDKSARIYGDLTADGATISQASFQANGLLLASVVEAANTPGDTTPTVAGINSMVITNAGATTITDFDDGVEAQIVIFRFADGNTTVAHDAGGGGIGPIYLSGGANKTFAADQMLVLVQRSTSIWYQIGGEI